MIGISTLKMSQILKGNIQFVFTALLLFAQGFVTEQITPAWSTEGLLMSQARMCQLNMYLVLLVVSC